MPSVIKRLSWASVTVPNLRDFFVSSALLDTFACAHYIALLYLCGDLDDWVDISFDFYSAEIPI